MLLKMPPPATDGKVDAKDIAPNWKVLQMELIYTSFVHRFWFQKLKEEEANAPPKEKKTIPFNPNKKRKFNDGAHEPAIKKTRKVEIPVTGADKETLVLFIC